MIFKNGYITTQEFGERPEYYKQFGFNGHEGIDIIPKDNDWDIYAPEDGIILQDVDDPRNYDAYGNRFVLWNKEKRRAWWFAHNTENYVSYGQEIKAGQKIAKMGATGNTSGAHVHLGLRLSDENANPMNTSNGYKGFINPKPVLDELANTSTNSPISMEDQKLAEQFRILQKAPEAKGVWYEAKNILDEYRARVTENSRKDQALDQKDKVIEQRDALIAKLNGLTMEQEEKLLKQQHEMTLMKQEREALKKEIIRISEQLDKSKHENDLLQKRLHEMEQRYTPKTSWIRSTQEILFVIDKFFSDKR